VSRKPATKSDRSCDYPLMLYRDGSSFLWDGREVDSLVVNNETEEDAALAEGWVRSFAEE
jgi:hypothetical protein